MSQARVTPPDMVFQLSGVGVAQTALPSGRFLRANESFCALLGYREAELKTLTLADVTEPDGAEGITTESAQVLRWRHRDGRSVWLEQHVSEFADEAGEAYCILVATDVSERFELEQQLRASEMRFQELADHAPMMVWVTDPEGVCTYLSHSWYAFTGQTPATGLGFGWLEAVHPDDRAASHDTFVTANAARRSFQLEYRLRRQDGSYRWAIDSAAPRFGEQGEFLGYTGSVIDISEHKEAEDALSKSEARYRTLFDSIDQGFCVIEVLFDAAGAAYDYRFLEMNPMFEQQTGLSNVVGKTALEAVPGLEAHWFATYGEIARSGRAKRFVNGSEAMNRWFDVYAFRLNNEEPNRVAVLFSDVTQRHRAETALRDLNTTLERRVAERTAELLQSEQRFTQAFGAAPVAACIGTLDGTLLDVNETFSELTGYSAAEAVGASDQQLALWVSPADGPFRGLQAGGRDMRDVELQLRRKSGEIRDVSVSSSLIPLGEQDGYLSVFYDITRRKEAEAGQELLRQAMDNAEEAAIITTALLDLPGPQIIYVNAAFTAMTGYTREEVIGQTPRMFQGPKSDRAVLRRLRRKLTKGEPFEGEVINYRKDGSSFTLAWNVAPIRDAAGAITHYVSVQQDVSERRALERELLDISAREQRRIAGNLHDSVQQQLVGTAMQARHLASMAKTRAPAMAADLDDLYALMQESVASVRTVLGGITPVQQTENGLMVALESMTQRIVTLFRTPCTFSFERPLLVKDFERATHLYYIVQEAAINAAKHAQASLIEVRLAGNSAASEYTLTVSDDGQGLSEAARQQRSGMGLDLMEYRAKLLGIELSIDSSPGRGTTVSCTFEGE